MVLPRRWGRVGTEDGVVGGEVSHDTTASSYGKVETPDLRSIEITDALNLCSPLDCNGLILLKLRKMLK